MKKESCIHGLILVLVLLASGFAVFHQATNAAWEPMPTLPPLAAPATVTDTLGEPVPTADYQRVVVCTGTALVYQLIPVERIIAVDAEFATDWRFAGCTRISNPNDPNEILNLRPDLVIAHGLDVTSRSAIRAAGCKIFDPGEVSDFAGFEEICRELGDLLHARRRAETLLAIAQRRARILALHAPAAPLLASQRVIPAGETTRFERLRAAFALAGVTLAEPAAAIPDVTLAVDTLSDPLGSDLVEIATEVRTRFSNFQP